MKGQALVAEHDVVGARHGDHERRARDANITVEEAERRAVSEIPIGRMVEPEEIANLVLFLVSEKAAAITGQTIAVEGGAGRGVSY